MFVIAIAMLSKDGNQVAYVGKTAYPTEQCKDFAMQFETEQQANIYIIRNGHYYRAIGWAMMEVEKM